MTIYSLFIRHFPPFYVALYHYDKPNSCFKRFSLSNTHIVVNKAATNKQSIIICPLLGPAGPNGTVAR